MKQTCLVLPILITGCLNTDTGEQQSPRERVLLQFAARIDPAASSITFETTDTSANGIAPLYVVQDGLPNSGPIDSIELVTTNTGNGASFCGASHPNSFCGDVTIRSFYGVDLENVYGVVTAIVPSTGNEGQNSDPSQLGMSSLLGLWRHGSIPAGNGATRTWIFGDNGSPYTIWGEVRGDLPQTVPQHCAETLTRYPGTTSGIYTIDPDGQGGGAPFDAYCDMATEGGGWTLIGTNAREGEWYTISNILDASTFGAISLASDFKGIGFTTVPLSELLFQTDVAYAVYNVGNHPDYLSFSDSVPRHNCGYQTVYEWPMVAGNFGIGSSYDLCNNHLYMHTYDFDGGTVCGSVVPNDADGPNWNAPDNNGCHHDDPSHASFIYESNGRNIWGAQTPLRMYVR